MLRLGLRSRALTPVLLAILPLLGLILFSYFDQRDLAIREVQRDESVAVKNLASSLEVLVNNTKNLLTTLARVHEVQHLHQGACNDFFADLHKQSPNYAAFVATDSEGRLLCSVPAAPGPITYVDRPWFQKVKQTKELVLGETVLGRVSGKYGHNVVCPILDGKGRFRGALTAQLDLNWLSSLLAKSDFPPTTAIVLTDSSRKVLWRYPEPEKYLGKMLPEAFMEPMATSDEGIAAGVGLPGDERLFAFVRLSPPLREMRLAIGVPMEWAVRPANHALGRNLLWLGLVALFAMAAAWFGGDLFVVRPVRKLRAATERLAGGDLSVRTGPPYPPGDLGLLAHSFDKMAEALQGREAALQKSEERFHSFMDNNPAIAWAKDEAGRYVYLNRACENRFGVRLEDWRGKTDYEVWPQEIAEVFRRSDLKVLPGGRAVEVMEETINPDGGRCFWWIFKFLFTDAAGARYVGGIGIDITELKAANESIQRLTHELMRAQEQERHKIALELHDTVAQELASLKIGLENLRHSQQHTFNEELDSQFATLLEKLKQSLKSIRTLSYDLRPPDLEHLGLVQALQMHCEEVVARTGLKIDFEAAGIDAIHLNYEAAINLYRIIQEGLTNVARHARAENVSIRLVASHPKIILRLEDDGQGLEVTETTAPGRLDRGMGLPGMRERVAFLGGAMEVASRLGQGTRIKIEIPWNGDSHGSEEKDSHR